MVGLFIGIFNNELCNPVSIRTNTAILIEHWVQLDKWALWLFGLVPVTKASCWCNCTTLSSASLISCGNNTLVICLSHFLDMLRRVLCISPIQQRGQNHSFVLRSTIKCPCCQSRRLQPLTVLLVLETDWVNLNPTMAPINSSLGAVMGVRGATLLLEAISCVVTKPSLYLLCKYDTAP